jgi:hypothetical protein
MTHNPREVLSTIPLKNQKWTSPRKPEGRISLSGHLGSWERLLEFWDGEVLEGGMPSSAVVGDFNPLKKNALREVELKE